MTEFNKNDMARSLISDNELTYGKDYKVLNVNIIGGYEHICIINDRDEYDEYGSRLFKVVKLSNKDKIKKIEKYIEELDKLTVQLEDVLDGDDWNTYKDKVEVNLVNHRSDLLTLARKFSLLVEQ